ncbi:Ig-like domain repeat protein [Streptomyces benahoarensis]|uniref:Beta-propeller fold lactonase family protein n=1 Tax=Streptomyces benahoarensis TaxID=2595054 RepID=A0A553ZQ68_9ACTN|nr:Ig-like domain repeat protein [Streptomyces benahoarensis]TSB32070.1 beta-propeller fold lactonase family protein [Streptomyces benahoarensis]TSB43607.1 beta-propeller fold lactonase family protein [Streptomyces benahoarensis]
MTEVFQSSWRQLIGLTQDRSRLGLVAMSSDPTVTVGSFPTGVAITPNGLRAYVANEGSNNVSVIDTTSLTVTATVPVGATPFGVAITPDGLHAYVTNSGGNSVSVIATATNTVTATIPVGSTPLGVAITPDGLHAYVTNSGGNSVSVIATATNTVTATIPVGATPFGVAITPDGLRAYVTNSGGNSVSVIATATNTVTAITLVGAIPLGVAIAGTRAYVANNGDNNVSVINTVTSTVITTVSVGIAPLGVAVSPDGAHAYVANNSNNTVSVIATATNTVTGTVPTGPGPFELAVTPDNSTLYITDNADNSVTVTSAGPASTTTGLVSVPDPSVFGQTKILTATVTALSGTPAGTVSFFDGVTPLGTSALNGSGVATLPISTLGVGSHALTATYNGGAGFNPSTSPVDAQAVNKASTVTVLIAAPNPSAPGQTVVLTATVAAIPPGAGTRTGTVSFFDGATLLGTSAVNAGGVATFTTATLSAGSHTLTAVYSGDGNFTGSSGTYITQVIVATVPTSLTATPAIVNLHPPRPHAGILTATLTNAATGHPIPGQPITFSTGNVQLGTSTTNARGTATWNAILQLPLIILNRGYTATYPGSSVYRPATALAGIISD